MLNKMILQGRFVRTPELKQTPNGMSVCSFTIAWSETYKEKKTECFLNCVAWNNTAEFINRYFSKGDQVIVEGKMVTRNYENEGTKKYVTELLTEQVHFCGSKKQENSRNDFEGIETDNDLPF